eukprot:gene3827-13897_t
MAGREKDPGRKTPFSVYWAQSVDDGSEVALLIHEGMCHRERTRSSVDEIEIGSHWQIKDTAHASFRYQLTQLAVCIPDSVTPPFIWPLVFFILEATGSAGSRRRVQRKDRQVLRPPA